MFDSVNGTFSCHFTAYDGNTTCKIVYGPRSSMNQPSPSIKYQVEKSSTDKFVTVTLSKSSLQTAPETIFHFVAFGTTENYTIAVEGTFETSTGKQDLL